MKDATPSPPATLESKLAEGRFVITAEVAPPLTASADVLIERVKPLEGLVDAVNVTDAASARAALSSFAASAILVREGFEPVLQTTCRDRNRIALSSDLLGAAAQGVRNLLILHGDDPKTGDMPDAKPVYDLDSRAVMSLARDMRDEGCLLSGREIIEPPHFHIGCADAPVDPSDNWEPKGLEAKIAAGAQFAQTQFCFDAALAERYFARLDALGITKRLKIIAGIGPLLSAKQARFMNEKLFGVSIPASIIDRLEAASDPKAEGRAICVELIDRLRAMKGVSGVHIMAPLQSPEAIAETVKLGGWR
ncbi:MAG: methylenetetrahydrofolate reductase [Rhizobiales bacterium]|nr:methylenetetrahydrofolate reductase [Hyphomicrobiales bacterium]